MASVQRFRGSRFRVQRFKVQRFKVPFFALRASQGRQDSEV